MTRFPHDQFAKDYLKELLTPLGEVETSRDVTGEVREIDVWFTPAPRSPGDAQGLVLKTALVVIHQLPRTSDTLWLRILGKGRVQQQAVDELAALPVENPFRSNALELLYSLKSNLEASQNLDVEDRDLIMQLSPLYLQRLEEATQQGRQAERRTTIENLLLVRFGSLDDTLSDIIPQLLELPPEEFTQLLLQLSSLSREDLLARFVRRFN